MADNLLRTLEVPARIELASGGFADPCLTTWLRHHDKRNAGRTVTQVRVLCQTDTSRS